MAAAPDFFAHPRVVTAAVADGDGELLRDRLYLGFQRQAGVIEVISYNETLGRFEFQIVRNYVKDGAPQAVYAYFAGRFIGKQKEELFVLALDTRGRLLGAPQLIAGAVNAVPVRPIEVFREPLVRNAVSILLVHNHPSGDPRPSAADVRLTKEIIASGKLLEVEVVDHVIVGTGRYVSMREAGYAFG